MNTLLKLALNAALFSTILTHVLAGRTEENIEKSFTLPPESEIVIEAENANLTIEGSDSETITVSILRTIEGISKKDGQEFLDNSLVEFNTGPTQLFIKSATKASSENKHKLHYQEQITINTPYKSPLAIKSEDGNIHISKIESDVEIKVEEGNLTCSNLKGSLLTKMEDGNLRCHQFSGYIEAKLENGNASVQFSEMPKETCHISVEDGNIHLDLSDSYDLLINAKTEDGYINSDFPVQNQIRKKDDHSAEIKINQGKRKFFLKSEDGNINIKRSP